MVDVTLLEVNLEGSRFTAHAPFSGEDSAGGKVSRLLGKKGSADDSDTDSHDADADVDEGESDGPPGPLAAVVALALVVVLAVLVRKLRGGPDREPPEELDIDADEA